MDIAAFARGFLSLVGAKTLGKGLQQAADFVQPTLEMAPMLGANLRIQQFEFQNPIVAGPNNILTVPANEIWRVKAGHISVSCVAGAGIQNAAILVFTPEAPPNALASRYVLGSETIDLAVGAAATSTLKPWLWPDLILNGGSILSLFCTAVLGAGVVQGHISAYVEVSRA